MKKYQKAKLVAIISLVCICIVGSNSYAEKYQGTEESLTKHGDAPEWLRDAKLGIYFHWGVYSVPAFSSEWYPRIMYNVGSDCNKHHIATYGEPTEFGYHDFVPMFRAENFDAEQWAKLFKQAGAKFAGPVAEHHDGFSMWASKLTPWNAAEKGPKRDLLGEIAGALKKEDLKLITTFHHARNSLWEIKPGQFTGHYDDVKRNYPSLLENPENAILYGYIPRAQFLDMWVGKLKEVIDNYQPDIIWFDSWLHEIPEKERFDFASYYFNRAEEWGKEVAIVRKQNDMPIEFTMLDHEKSREAKINERLWMTDDTISSGSWCYTNNLKIKPTSKIVHAMIDTVSKNGVVLLNISPMADGTIPQDQKDSLIGLGNWLKVNGEGIYNTRPWHTFGQGPTKEPTGGFRDHGKFLALEYSAQDIRYTQSKDGKTLYAILMGWPEENITLEDVKLSNPANKFAINLLGSDASVKYEINDDNTLTIIAPKLAENDRPCKYAYVFKITQY